MDGIFISAQVHKCLGSFEALSRAIIGSALGQYQNPAVLVAVQDQAGRFRVWSGNMGAHQTGKASLDYRLRNSKQATQTVGRLLQYLNRLLNEGKAHSDSSPVPNFTVSYHTGLQERSRNI